MPRRGKFPLSSPVPNFHHFGLSSAFPTVITSRLCYQFRSVAPSRSHQLPPWGIINLGVVPALEHSSLQLSPSHTRTQVQCTPLSVDSAFVNSLQPVYRISGASYELTHQTCKRGIMFYAYPSDNS